MRRFCKYSGMEIKKNWNECVGCDLLVESDCPQYGFHQGVTTKEFSDWFYEHKVKPTQCENDKIYDIEKMLMDVLDDE